MSPDPLAPVWPRLDSARPVFLGGEPGGPAADARDQLVGLGVLRETTPAAHAFCTECGDGHLVRVAWVSDPRAGGPEPRLPCPACGLVPVPADSLRRWVVDVPELLAQVSAAAGLRRVLAEVVPNHLWYLGGGTWCGRSRQVYFARFVHGPPRAAVRAALAPYPAAVLFHPTEHAARVWGGTTPNLLAALEAVVSLGPAGLSFDPVGIEAGLADAGQVGPKVPRPARKRAGRTAAIDRLTRALIDHLRTAKEHAHSIQRLTGNPELYPRPTKLALARMTGLSASAVTRCFDDPAAAVLNYYWDVADDLDRVMEFDGSGGGRAKG